MNVAAEKEVGTVEEPIFRGYILSFSWISCQSTSGWARLLRRQYSVYDIG